MISDTIAGLSKKYILAMSAVFKKFPEIDNVKIFGSRAKGNYAESSDIDLSIQGRLDYKTLSKIKFDLDDSDISYLMEVQDYNAIKNISLKEHIDRIGKTVYQKL